MLEIIRKNFKMTLKAYSHQHLSNLYWWNRMLFPELTGKKKELVKFQQCIVLEVFDEKYQGRCLEYVAFNRAENEVSFLRNNFNVKLVNVKNRCYNVFFDGEVDSTGYFPLLYVGKYYDMPVPSILNFI